jgi:hypothetical protein
MMVPRSYSHTSPSLKSWVDSEKDVVPVKARDHVRKLSSKKDKALGSGKPTWMSSALAATPSKPMVIPTRTRNRGARRTQEASYGKTCSIEDGAPHMHDPTAVPTSAAAFIAITSPVALPLGIEAPRTHRFDGGSRKKRTREEELGIGQYAMSALSPRSWSMLLSPPNESDLENISIGSDTTLAGVSFGRSLSNESMPSLDTDYGSSTSASSISTPRTSCGSRGGIERKPRGFCSLKIEKCPLNHPLLPLPPTEDPGLTSLAIDTGLAASESPSTTRRQSGFKSNLSALLRSAARSFSNFSAPAISRDEYLTRSVLPIYPPFTDERRPLPLLEPPDPTLRRYLNPITASPAELHTHHKNAPSQKARSQCTTSIQLQTYQRTPRPSAKASAPPIFASANAAIAEAADEPFTAPSPRQRELRENSDFLRVIVLEMNMRRSGIMSETAPGKARMWLPARQVGKREEEGSQRNGVPRRLVGMTSRQLSN